MEGKYKVCSVIAGIDMDNEIKLVTSSEIEAETGEGVLTLRAYNGGRQKTLEINN